MGLKDEVDALPTTHRLMKVTVPEWGDRVVYVRPLTGAEFEALRATPDGDGEDVKDETFAEKVMKYCVDEHGVNHFTAADLDWLQSQPGTALARIVGAINQINRISQDNIEDAAKN